MKTSRFTSIFYSSLVAGAMALAMATNHSALAQVKEPLTKAKIPFAFQVGDRLMPAGTYEIDRQGGPLVLLRGGDQGPIFIMTHAATTSNPSATGRVIFERYGNKYFLRQVWAGSSVDGAELSKCKAEKEIIKAMQTQVASSGTQVASFVEIASIAQH